MGNLHSAIKEAGLIPDQKKLNHWKQGVPQNPDGLAYKIYHFHLNNAPCTISDLCRGIGLPTKQTHKVSFIIKKLQKAGTWRWLKRPDREQAKKDQMQKIADRHGEEV